jgi:hypothetical protein
VTEQGETRSGGYDGIGGKVVLTIMAIDSPPQSMKNAVNQLFLTQ